MRQWKYITKAIWINWRLPTESTILQLDIHPAFIDIWGELDEWVEYRRINPASL
jgi:hypothetical protein